MCANTASDLYRYLCLIDIHKAAPRARVCWQSLPTNYNWTIVRVHEQKAHGQQLISVVNISTVFVTLVGLTRQFETGKPVFTHFHYFVVPTSCSDTQMWPSGNFRGDETDKTDCFTPCACSQGSKLHSQERNIAHYSAWYDVYKNAVHTLYDQT